MVLFKTLANPPMTNVEVQKTMAGGEDGRVKLYRGLGLPEDAIKVYHDFIESGKAFSFTGFTSTSCEKEQAMVFAYKATQKKGMVPVLFVMDTEHENGSGKAFLHDGSLSAFPKEKEYLIGDVDWTVKKIAKEPLESPSGKPFMVTVI